MVAAQVVPPAVGEVVDALLRLGLTPLTSEALAGFVAELRWGGGRRREEEEEVGGRRREEGGEVGGRRWEEGEEAEGRGSSASSPPR